MPLYDFKCKNCSNIFEIFLSLNEINKKINCNKCHSDAFRYFGNSTSNLYFQPVFYGYYDYGINKFISSKRQIRELEKNENMLNMSFDEMKQETEKNRKKIEIESEKKFTENLRDKINKAIRK